MTATDELHRLLTEAGVEYQFNDATKIFEWHYDGTDGEGFAHATEAHGGINIIACSLTPERVIAATLGHEPDDAVMLKLHERMNAALLEFERAMGIEKADGAITVPFVAEIHNLLEEAATLGAGTCENDAPEPYYFVCSKCGIGLNFNVRFCPFCGRYVKGVD